MTLQVQAQALFTEMEQFIQHNGWYPLSITPEYMALIEKIDLAIKANPAILECTIQEHDLYFSAMDTKQFFAALIEWIQKTKTYNDNTIAPQILDWLYLLPASITTHNINAEFLDSWDFVHNPEVCLQEFIDFVEHRFPDILPQLTLIVIRHYHEMLSPYFDHINFRLQDSTPAKRLRAAQFIDQMRKKSFVTPETIVYMQGDRYDSPKVGHKALEYLCHHAARRKFTEFDRLNVSLEKLLLSDLKDALNKPGVVARFIEDTRSNIVRFHAAYPTLSQRMAAQSALITVRHLCNHGFDNARKIDWCPFLLQQALISKNPQIILSTIRFISSVLQFASTTAEQWSEIHSLALQALSIEHVSKTELTALLIQPMQTKFHLEATQMQRARKVLASGATQDSGHLLLYALYQDRSEHTESATLNQPDECPKRTKYEQTDVRTPYTTTPAPEL